MYLFKCLPFSPPWIFPACLFMSGVVADYSTTVIATKRGGKEGNPLANWLFRRVGVKIGGLMVVAFFALIVMTQFRNLPSYQRLALAFTYWLVPFNNYLVIKRLS